MSVHLAKNTSIRLRRKKYISCCTSFLAVDGPVAGTIWFDTDNPRVQTLTVVQVKGGRVYFDGLRNEERSPTAGPQRIKRLPKFLEDCRTGRFVLIGVTEASHPTVVNTR